MPNETSFSPLRSLPSSDASQTRWKKGDVLVVFGELFARGYANGLVDEATRAGMTVIRSTVGRRNPDDTLRPLNTDELALQPQPFINVPLEAGFDMEPAASGRSPVDQLQGIKMGEWAQAKLDWAEVEDSRARGVARFEKAVAAYVEQLEKLIPSGANVLFAHTMAGGVPRAKILMPTMNRVFKGIGDRHASSEMFWNSDIGRLSAMSFDEVTANTFDHLLKATKSLRTRIERDGGRASYVAYGYHGTEILIGGEYRWQTYTPYVQGWAKIRLENFATAAAREGVRASVYNCPEILTNSSSIFLGVEVSLYPLIEALRKEGAKSERAKDIVARCGALLKEGATLETVREATDRYMRSPLMQEFNVYEGWPKHNRRDEMETMLAASAELIGLHRDEKQLITYVLSEEVFRACGYLMFHEAWQPSAPVLWLGHDVLAKALASGRVAGAGD